ILHRPSPAIECVAPESAQPIPLTWLILIGKKAIRVEDLKTDKVLNSLRFFVGEQAVNDLLLKEFSYLKMDCEAATGPCRFCHPTDPKSRHKTCDCAYTTPALHAPKSCYCHGSPIGHHTLRSTCCHGTATYKWPQEGFRDPDPGPPACTRVCRDVRVQSLDWWLPHCKYLKPADRNDFYLVHVCDCLNPSKILHCARLV
ncbi:hypothetical protein AVEN_267191-1, partial [Araneus ventricosus]